MSNPVRGVRLSDELDAAFLAYMNAHGHPSVGAAMTELLIIALAPPAEAVVVPVIPDPVQEQELREKGKAEAKARPLKRNPYEGHPLADTTPMTQAQRDARIASVLAKRVTPPEHVQFWAKLLGRHGPVKVNAFNRS